MTPLGPVNFQFLFVPSFIDDYVSQISWKKWVPLCHPYRVIYRSGSPPLKKVEKAECPKPNAPSILFRKSWIWLPNVSGQSGCRHALVPHEVSPGKYQHLDQRQWQLPRLLQSLQRHPGQPWANNPVTSDRSHSAQLLSGFTINFRVI